MNKYGIVITFILLGMGGWVLSAPTPYTEMGNRNQDDRRSDLFSKTGTNVAGYAQLRYSYTEDDPNVAATPANMELKKLCLNIAGTLQYDIGYRIEYDFKNSQLTDAMMQMKHLPYYDWTVTLGQFKLPFSDAGINLDTPYQDSIRGLMIYESVTPVFHDRDVGIMVEGDMLDKKGVYSIGIFNGEGPNANDTNDQKDFLIHFKVSPWKDENTSSLKPLEFGASFMKGVVSEINATGIDKADRYCYTMKYEIEKVVFTYENLYQNLDIDGTRDMMAKAWYLQAIYDWQLQFFNKMQSIQVFSRYEYYDPDSLTDDDQIHCTTLGTNWLVNNNLKIKINNNIYRETPKIKNDEVLVQLEIKF
jgi:hypothetical protein